MNLLLIGLALWTAVTAVLVAVVFVARRVCGGRPRWRRIAWIALGSLPVHALLSVPATLGYLGANFVHTRRDEAAYAGPRLDADGEWSVQTPATLSADTPPATPSPLQVELRAKDDVPLRAFLVPAKAPARADALLVHGLFRGGLELETVGRWLHDLGCDVLLLELRNHGGSGRAPASFGPREALDVRAAAQWLDQRAAGLGSGNARPLLLFGVSLGSVASALAAPELPRLRYLVLDAPVIDPGATAHRMLRHGPRRAQGRLGFPEPFCTLSLWFLQQWAGIDLATIAPLAALRRVRADVRALVIGGGNDDRVPATDVDAAFQALAAPASLKELWIAEGAGHGTVWETAPDEYRARLAKLLQR